MDEIGQEDALIAQFSGIASVPASEVHRLQTQLIDILSSDAYSSTELN
jgi:hypothetical protein